MTLPVALDTNLLVRLLTGDEPDQARRVADLIDTSPACFVPITVVLELEWGLRGAYRLDRQALAWHRQGLDFADALHLLRSEGCGRFATLDRALVKAVNALDLQPTVSAL
jgi:predicted nucleic-acid-binding protein